MSLAYCPFWDEDRRDVEPRLSEEEPVLDH